MKVRWSVHSSVCEIDKDFMLLLTILNERNVVADYVYHCESGRRKGVADHDKLTDHSSYFGVFRRRIYHESTRVGDDKWIAVDTAWRFCKSNFLRADSQGEFGRFPRRV